MPPKFREIRRATLPPNEGLRDLIALDSERAVGLVRRPVAHLVRFDADGMTRVQLTEEMIGEVRKHDDLALVRVGERFGVFSPTRLSLWTSLEEAPETFTLEPEFPKDNFGTTHAPAKGAISDDPELAVVLLHTPRNHVGIHGIGFARLHADGRAVWERLEESGEPLTLRREDFPVPAEIASFPKLFKAPLLKHAAWISGRLLAFSPGMSSSYIKYGNHFTVVADVDAEGRSRIAFETKENAIGEFSNCGRYLILDPTRLSGEWKGKPRVWNLETEEFVEIGQLGKRTKLKDHRDGTWWIVIDHQTVCALALDA